jgi:hypothetical protein
MLLENRDTAEDRGALGEPEVVKRVADRLRTMDKPPWKWKR